ncbi:universal stress protein [Flavobacteriaceae bacterium F89]|uniref:Universal stress protein n=1 Tax=Cerina litoralis TaxID=2874477 RepID=A0AAE3EZ20_9FLAO|nr:universal stress protein [Cerina litoralis]MCG2462246.1 universal stress protein [Cerina litoralis]
MKKVLLPTDFSENSYKAIGYAMRLFKDQECTFFLLHTYTPAIYQAEYVMHAQMQVGLGDFYRSNSIQQLEKLQDRITTEFKNPKHKFVVRAAFNLLVDEILVTIDNEKIDLVVMGTQGASGAKEIFFGTNTIHVIKKTTCPVIAVPVSNSHRLPQNILFPTDYEVSYQNDQFSELKNIVTMHRSKLMVLHISASYELDPDRAKNKSKLLEIFKGMQIDLHEVGDQGVISAINGFQSDNDVDFLVMVQHKRTFLERLFMEPVINKIGFHVTIPFMVIPGFEQ